MLFSLGGFVVSYCAQTQDNWEQNEPTRYASSFAVVLRKACLGIPFPAVHFAHTDDLHWFIHMVFAESTGNSQ